MKLLLLLFTALLGLVLISPCEAQERWHTNKICIALAKGSDYKDCNWDWAVYNGCKCFRTKNGNPVKCENAYKRVVSPTALRHM